MSEAIPDWSAFPYRLHSVRLLSDTACEVAFRTEDGWTQLFEFTADDSTHVTVVHSNEFTDVYGRVPGPGPDPRQLASLVTAFFRAARSTSLPTADDMARAWVGVFGEVGASDREPPSLPTELPPGEASLC